MRYSEILERFKITDEEFKERTRSFKHTFIESIINDTDDGLTIQDAKFLYFDGDSGAAVISSYAETLEDPSDYALSIQLVECNYCDFSIDILQHIQELINITHENNMEVWYD